MRTRHSERQTTYRQLSNEVGKRLAAHCRFHPHFTPASSPGPNLVKRWFVELSRYRLRRPTHRSVTDFERLKDQVEDELDHYASVAWPQLAEVTIRWHSGYSYVGHRCRSGRKLINGMSSLD